MTYDVPKELASASRIFESFFFVLFVFNGNNIIFSLIPMNKDPTFPKSSLASPRLNRQRYHELKRETDTSDESAEKEDRPSTTSLKRALARANLKGDCVLSGYASTLPSFSGNPEPDSRMNSSLPLALARANESRRMDQKDSLSKEEAEDQDTDTVQTISLADFFFRFGSFADAVHPLRGWGVFGLFYFLNFKIYPINKIIKKN